MAPFPWGLLSRAYGPAPPSFPLPDDLARRTQHALRHRGSWWGKQGREEGGDSGHLRTGQLAFSWITHLMIHGLRSVPSPSWFLPQPATLFLFEKCTIYLTQNERIRVQVLGPLCKVSGVEDGLLSFYPRPVLSGYVTLRRA